MSTASVLDDIINGIKHIFQEDMSPEHVAQSLDNHAKMTTEELDWRHSIVDLMKLLGLDSTLKARRILATELGYTGIVEDNSAEMNNWLHAHVLEKVAEHGYAIPTT